MKKTRGFTLIELLVVVTILALLIIGALLSLNKNRDKATDAKSKSDLSRLKIAFEDYYNDKNCYPPAEWFDGTEDCGSSSLKPYLAQIPCDPRTGKPYVLETDATACGWFKLYGQLTQTVSDPEALELCDALGSTLGTYGVSSSNTSVTINCAANPSPTPAPIPSTTPGIYACTPTGNCSAYSAENLILYACPVTFNSGEIGSQCDLYCQTSGSARCSN
jgi:prepilin-type N-terminal cleavage/methylation domain-containing protein